MSTGFVLFRLGERVFATELDDVREIVRLQGLQRLPGARPPLAGVLTLRGAPLPVLDIRSHAGVAVAEGGGAGVADPTAGGPGTGSATDHRDNGGDVLVVADGDSTVGIAVDGVVAVAHPDELPPAGASPSPVLPDYVVGVRSGADGPVLQVELRRLLTVTAAGWHEALTAVP